MPYPPLLTFAAEHQFRAYFEDTYCRRPISTFDGIAVRFRKENFDHCCFESSQRNKTKDTFSMPRAERLHWIALALQDRRADRFVGWDGKRKRYDRKRRVTLVMDDFVVVIQLTKPGQARFVTCYVADSVATLTKIRKGPRWEEYR